MAALGIVQETTRLRRPARPFNLPGEAEDARQVITSLKRAERVARTCSAGHGIAAPQIGIDRAAAIVCTPITLCNPSIIESGDDADELYEGCLFFFDVPGHPDHSL